MTRRTTLASAAAATLLLASAVWITRNIAPRPAYNNARTTPAPLLHSSDGQSVPPTPNPTEFITETASFIDLARGGSPAEIDMLLDHLQRESSPQRRQTLLTALASISNRAAAGHLIARLTTVTDEDAILGLQRALSSMADDGITRQLAAAYETVPESAAPRLTKVVETILQDSAVPALAALVSDPAIPASDQLTAAALSALARLGTPYAAATLARRLDASTSQEDINHLSRLLAAVNRTSTEAELAAIARGQQDAARTHTRLAALRALRHYPGPSTLSLLDTLAADSDPQVAAQARALRSDLTAP